MAIEHTFITVGGKLKTRKLTRKKAIREFCVHCMQSPIEVRFCTSKTCALYPFRVGSEGSADQEEAGDGGEDD